METIKPVLVPIHKEGYIFILICAVLTLFLFILATPLGWLGVLLTAWCTFFFRDPERITPDKKGLIVSPADGVVQKVEMATPPEEFGVGDKPLMRISIFLNIFNVHINRIPIEGTVTNLTYHPGKFFNASLDKASVHNERQSVGIVTETGQTIFCVQIAGLIARRIVCYLKKDQNVRTGERFGLIRFGSRADIYLPEGVHPLVVEGQQMIGGETVLADLESTEPQRTGTILARDE